MHDLIIRVTIPENCDFDTVRECLIDGLDPAGDHPEIEAKLQRPVMIKGRFEGFVDA